MLLTEKQKQNVISHLKENYDLPSQGFVAGQAVASLIYKELNLNISGPINDIDVFTSVDLKHAYSFKARMNTHHTKESLFINGGSFSTTITSMPSRSYRVVQSLYTDDTKKINLIKVVFTNGVFSELDILKSFDFNCCSVGFDLLTEKFYFTDAFIDFCKTKQLMILSAHTPFHSLLRLNKKIDDIKGAFCNKKREQEVLLFSFFMGKSYFKNQIVGDKFLKLFEKQQDSFLKDAIHLKECEDHCNEEDKDLFKGKVYYKISFNEKLLFNKFEFIKQHFEKPIFYLNSSCSFNINDFFPLYSSTNVVHFYHILSDSALFDQKYKKRVLTYVEDNSLNKKVNSFFSLGEMKNLTKLLFRLMINEKDALQKVSYFPSVKDCAKLFFIFTKHPLFINNLYIDNGVHNYTLKDFLVYIRRITNSIKKDSKKEFIYGLYESNSISLKEISDCITLDYLTLRNKLINEKNICFKRQFNDFKLFNFEFRQLITYDDFELESKNMQHCILGHFSKVNKPDHSFYYHIKTPYGHSTIEVNKIIVQHYGFKNSFVHYLNKLIGYFIHARLNNNYKLFFKSLFTVGYKTQIKINKIKEQFKSFFRPKRKKELDIDNIPF